MSSSYMLMKKGKQVRLEIGGIFLNDEPLQNETTFPPVHDMVITLLHFQLPPSLFFLFEPHWKQRIDCPSKAMKLEWTYIVF